jgi:hypothetical protein
MLHTAAGDAAISISVRSSFVSEAGYARSCVKLTFLLIDHWWASSLVAAFCAGCSSSSAKAGPSYCAQNAGPVDSCEMNATTGPVTLCGPQFPLCTSPNQSGGGGWACCKSAVAVSPGVQETTCSFTISESGDASCPCAGCDAGQ